MTEQSVVDLGDVVRGAQSMIARVAGDDIKLAVRLHPGPLWVVANVGQLIGVLMNLVLNVRDVMSPGSGLSIRTSVITLTESHAEQHATHTGRHAVLTVTDTGIGVDAESQSRIFEPFFTSSPEVSGTGIGLLTVLGIVEQLGGRMFVHSEPHQGTTFKIYLPCVDGARRPAQTESTTPAIPRMTRATVLLVDDDDMLRRVTRRMLERSGYVVHDVANGAAALRFLRDSRVDIVVTDALMPGMDGRELAARVRTERPQMPVLVISGDNEIMQGEDPVSDLQLFLEKPYAAETLDAMVREGLRRAACAREQ